MAKTVFTIQGTHCESCQALIEEVCREVPAVRSVAVDFRTGKSEIEHDGALDWPALQRAIESLGQYKVILPSV